MDMQDRQILNILQKDGRRSYSEIGNSVGLSTTAVKDRIDKLIKNSVLQNFSAEISENSVGLGVIAFILVGIDNPDDCEAFERMASNVSQIQECHHITGGFNYILKVLTTDMAALETLLSKHIKMTGIVSRTETTIVFSSIKNSNFVDCVLREN
ncbi:MAG: Lrp/AsnC family transcriptional regulator [Sneathiella sp.]|nr:Lrp/AsnC family transcriptional regulator [Sneathiella sp.]